MMDQTLLLLPNRRRLCCQVLALYHCVRVGWCTQCHQRRPPPQRRRRAFHFRHEEPPSNVEHSITKLIPVHKLRVTWTWKVELIILAQFAYVSLKKGKNCASCPNACTLFMRLVLICGFVSILVVRFVALMLHLRRMC